MLEFVDKVLPKESFACNFTMQKALILCEVLKQADIRRVTPYIAARYGEEFGTGWKDNKDLIKKFYKTHMPELYAYNAYKLNKILEYLVESIPTLLKQTTMRLDGAVIDNLNTLTDSLTKSDSSAIEIESALCTNIDDLLDGKPCIRRPIVNEFELLNKIVQCNVEINKDIRITHNGADRYNVYPFTNKLASICLDIMNKIQYRQGVCPAYKNWGTILEALYGLHVSGEWLYEHGHGKFFNYGDHKRIEPYTSMELEEVLVGPKDFVRVVYDDKLYKLSKCAHNTNRPENELVRAYVNMFYHVHYNYNRDNGTDCTDYN